VEGILHLVWCDNSGIAELF
jgi:hypothetical protein